MELFQKQKKKKKKSRSPGMQLLWKLVHQERREVFRFFLCGALILALILSWTYAMPILSVLQLFIHVPSVRRSLPAFVRSMVRVFIFGISKCTSTSQMYF
jgi:hypothetical protein